MIIEILTFVFPYSAKERQIGTKCLFAVPSTFFFKQLGKNEKQVQVVTLSKILVYNRKIGS